MSPRLLPVLAAVGVAALVVTSVGMGFHWQRASAAEERADALATEVEELEAQVARLEERLTAAEADTSDGDGVDDLLGGLLGDGGMGDLLSGGVPGQACLTPGGDLFDDLLGGDGLDDLLGGEGDPLDDLLGGGGGDELPDEPDELVDVVADHVAEMRELEWQEEVEVDFVDGAELSDRLETLIEQDTDPEAVEAEQRMLAALGAVPEDLDLAQVQRDLMDEQVAGYYVPDTGELVVRVPDDGAIRPMDRVTLAHELQHALADQTLGLPALDEEPYADDADAALGALGLIEGDATLLMNFWTLQHLSLTDQLAGALGGDLDAAQASLAAVPHHLQQELLYPYMDGLDYVCDLYLEGGWQAVDDAYADPPATSAEVLHPERGAAEPQTPAGLTAPAEGEPLLETTFGAAPLQWLFEAPGGDAAAALDAPEERAAVWDGGRVAAWDVAGATHVGLSLVDGGGGPSLCESVAAWHAAAFPGHDASGAADRRVFRGSDRGAALQCDDDRVRYASATDAGAALAIISGG